MAALYSTLLLSKEWSLTPFFLRGAVVADNRRGLAKGVAIGQFTNAAGHLVGLTLSGFAMPAFKNGAFVYDRAFMPDGGAITLGNVISGTTKVLNDTLSGTTSLVIEHERAHMPQSNLLGALYMPIHGLVLGVTNFLPGSHHGKFNFLEWGKWGQTPFFDILNRK